MDLCFASIVDVGALCARRCIGEGRDEEDADFSVYRAKGRTRDRWDAEWGSLDREGNLWWQGSAWKEWTSVMGTSWVGWICE